MQNDLGCTNLTIMHSYLANFMGIIVFFCLFVGSSHQNSDLSNTKGILFGDRILDFVVMFLDFYI